MRSVGFDDERWEPGEEVANAMGTSRTKVVNQLWDWWMGVPGARLPKRPPRELVEQATEAWKERKAKEEADRRRAQQAESEADPPPSS